MNPNSINDLFIFNFPKDFVPTEYEEKWKIHLKNFRKPFPTVLDYINSNIKDISLPGLSTGTTSQKKIYGKEVNYRSGKSPYDLSSREFSITMRNTDFNIFYFLMEDLIYYHFIKNKKPFIDEFDIYIIDNQRRANLKITLKQVLFLDLSDLKLGNQDKDVKEKTLTIKFKYNFKDIEYLLSYGDEYVNGEMLDEYSDIIIPNDDRVPLTPPTIDDGTDDAIIGH